jgi:hypothetical protein
MMIMTKDEVKQALKVWAANVKQPIDRDLQILLMKTAKQRREAFIERMKDMTM